MTTFPGRLRSAVIGALALVLVAVAAAPLAAQQPTSVNPTASAVKEDQLLNELHRVQGRGTIPDTKSQLIEHPAGRDWRQFHEVTLHWLGGIAILGMLGLIVVFYLIRGMVRLESGRSGRTIVRFNSFERFVHWMTATCFVILAISGLNITFGKELLLPWLSPSAFTGWSQTVKYLHNFLSFPFTIGVVTIFLIWIGGNIPNRLDLQWFKEGGGIIGHRRPPADHFNAGQKAIYWIVVLGGTGMAITGYLLMFPFYATDIDGMQLAQMTHAIIAVLFIAAMVAHIYIGTIGMEGAFEAMWDGEVDVNWAREHHRIWLERAIAEGDVRQPPPSGQMAPAR